MVSKNNFFSSDEPRAIAEAIDSIVKCSKEPCAQTGCFLQMLGIGFPKGDALESILQRAQNEMSRFLPKLGNDDFAIHLASFGKTEIPLEPKKTASPPKIVGMGFASGE